MIMMQSFHFLGLFSNSISLSDRKSKGKTLGKPPTMPLWVGLVEVSVGPLGKYTIHGFYG